MTKLLRAPTRAWLATLLLVPLSLRAVEVQVVGPVPIEQTLSDYAAAVKARDVKIADLTALHAKDTTLVEQCNAQKAACYKLAEKTGPTIPWRLVAIVAVAGSGFVCVIRPNACPVALGAGGGAAVASIALSF